MTPIYKSDGLLMVVENPILALIFHEIFPSGVLNITILICCSLK
jgi:dTDP-glucose pyrophosphorylase